MDSLGVGVHLRLTESKFAAKCHHVINFHKCNKNKFMFGKLHCFFLEKYFGGAYL